MFLPVKGATVPGLSDYFSPRMDRSLSCYNCKTVSYQTGRTGVIHRSGHFTGGAKT